MPSRTSSARASRFLTELVHWPHTVGSMLVAVVAQVLQPALVLVGQHLLRQRLEMPDIVGREADHLADPAAVVVVDQQQVPDHPLLHVALALPEQRAHVEDEVVAFPVHHGAVAAARLHVVVAPLDHAAGQPAVDLRRIVRRLPRRLAQPVVDGRLVVHVRVLTRRQVAVEGHLPAGEVGGHPRVLGLVHRQLQIVASRRGSAGCRSRRRSGRPASCRRRSRARPRARRCPSRSARSR